MKKNICLLFSGLFSAFFLFSHAWAVVPMPARIGGFVTSDGVVLTQASDEGYSFSVTHQDGSALVPAAETSELNTYNMYLIDIPIYDSTDQPQGAQPGTPLVMHAFYNGFELQIDTPANGEFVLGASGSIQQYDMTITGASGPLVSANADTLIGFAPLTINFTGTAQSGTPPYAFSWSFGDGNTSADQNPTHIYSTPGSYNAVVTGADSEGKTYSAALTITVASLSEAHFDTPDSIQILTDNNAPFTVSSTDTILAYGSKGYNELSVAQGARVKLLHFSGNNRISLATDIDQILVRRRGGTVYFEGFDDTILIIPATLDDQIIDFPQGTLTLYIDTGLNAVVIEGNTTQIIETVSQPIDDSLY